MASEYTHQRFGSIIPKAYAIGSPWKRLGWSIVGAVFSAVAFYMVRKPTEDGPSDYAEPFGHIPARVYLPSPRTLDRGGSPLSAAPVTSGPEIEFVPGHSAWEIEDDQWITVFCDGHWKWNTPVHGRTIGDE